MAELLAGFVSAKPVGAVTVAVLLRVPVASAAIVAVTTNETVPPAATSTSSAMLPAPLALPQTEPAVAVHDQVTPVNVAGIASLTATPAAADGPLLVTSMVYVVAAPGTAEICPSVLVIDRSPTGSTWVMSVAALFAVFGSVAPAGTSTCAVLVIVPAVAVTVAVTVNVTEAPTGRSTSSLMLPLPVAVQAPPPVAAQVHVAPARPAGMVSVTTAPVTADGPLLVATIW